MNEPIQKIFGNNIEKISEKIDRIENSLVGVGNQSADESGNLVNVLPYPVVDEIKSIKERMIEYSTPGLCGLNNCYNPFTAFDIFIKLVPGLIHQQHD
ncbi:MAG: hypothetical protein ACTSSK_11905 [Candidatus Heimdallarchaeota archaeon]